MPILKEFCLAIAAFVAFLYASHAYLGPDESDAVRYSVTSRQSWLGADAVPAERWLVKDSITTGAFWTGPEPAPAARRFAGYPSPAARVNQVFAQFVPGERRRQI